MRQTWPSGHVIGTNAHYQDEKIIFRDYDGEGVELSRAGVTPIEWSYDLGLLLQALLGIIARSACSTSIGR